MPRQVHLGHHIIPRQDIIKAVVARGIRCGLCNHHAIRGITIAIRVSCQSDGHAGDTTVRIIQIAIEIHVITDLSRNRSVRFLDKGIAGIRRAGHHRNQCHIANDIEVAAILITHRHEAFRLCLAHPVIARR